MKQPSRLAIVLVFVFVGASNPIAVKFALEAGWPLLPLGIGRMAVIALFFVAWTLVAREPMLAPTATGRRYSWLAAGCKGVGVLTFYLALSLTSANRVIVLSTFSPVVGLLMIDRFLEQEQVERRQWLGVVTSLIGLGLLLFFRGDLSFQGESSWRATLIGDLCMIVSVVFNTGMVIFEKRAILAGTNPRQLIVSTNMVSIAIFALIALGVSDAGFESIPTSSGAVWSFVYLVSVVGVFLFYYRRWMVGVLELGYITSFSHLAKAVSLFYAAVLLKETIPWSSLVAFALILAGSIVANRAGVAAHRGHLS